MGKYGDCGVKRLSSSEPQKIHQSCVCYLVNLGENSIPFYEFFYLFDVHSSNYCKLRCNGDAKCKGYTYAGFSVCKFFTEETSCDSDEIMKCSSVDNGNVGDVESIQAPESNEGQFSNFRGCYLKKPLNLPSGNFHTI